MASKAPQRAFSDKRKERHSRSWANSLARKVKNYEAQLKNIRAKEKALDTNPERKKAIIPPPPRGSFVVKGLVK